MPEADYAFKLTPPQMSFAEQLERWGQLHPEDKPMCDLAVKTLKEAAKNGYHDLSEMPSPDAKITSDLRDARIASSRSIRDSQSIRRGDSRVARVRKMGDAGVRPYGCSHASPVRWGADIRRGSCK